MDKDLISRSALKKAAENLVAGGAERLKDYFENGSKSEENEWIGGVYDVWELINNAQPIETTIENLISTLSVEELKATTWFKVETPAGEAVGFRREKTGHWLYRHYNWWCSECGEQPKTMGYVGTADFMFEEFKFCNHCGAKMIGVEKLEFFNRRLKALEDKEADNEHMDL